MHPSWHIDFRRDPPLVAKERYKKAFKDEFGWWIFANSSAPRVKRENAPQTQADWDKITPAVKETLQYQIRALLREEVEAYFARRAVETGSGEHPSANMRAAVLTKLDEVSTLLRAVNGRER